MDQFVLKQAGQPCVALLRAQGGLWQTLYLLHGTDQIATTKEWFIRRGSLPRERFAQDQPTQVKPVDTAPMFKRVVG
jgi:hypothetical protein